MDHNYHHTQPSPRYERPYYDYKDRYIQSLEDQIGLYKKHQQTHELQLQKLYTRISELEAQLHSAECSRCLTAFPNCQKLVCEECLSREHQFDSLQKAIHQERSHDGPACDGCRMRKRKCDRARPHCSYCVKLHRNQPGLPQCTYPDRKRKSPSLDLTPQISPTMTSPVSHESGAFDYSSVPPARE
jgi:hypothetical protein